MLNIKRILLLIVGGLGLLALIGWQYSVSSDEIRACNTILDNQERALQKMKAARANWELLQNDIDDHNAEIDRLARVLPSETDVDGFCKRLKNWLEKRDLKLCGQSDVEIDRDFYREAKLDLSICGPSALRATLAADSQFLAEATGPRLFAFEQFEQNEESLRVRINIYSFIVSGDRIKPAYCDQDQFPVIRTWLPTFEGWAVQARNSLDEHCAELEQNQEFIARVDELEAKRELILRKAEIIKALLEHGSAQTSEEITSEP